MPGTQHSSSSIKRAAKQTAPWTILFLFYLLNGLPAQENTVPTEHATEKWEQQIATDSGKLDELNSKITRIESDLAAQKDISEVKAIYTYDKRNIDLGYQSLFAYLAILTIVVAVAVVLFPILFTKHLREESRRAAEDTRQARLDAIDAANEAKIYLDKIKEHEKEAKSRLDHISSDKPLGEEDKQIVEEVQKDPHSSDRDRLLAAALNALNNKKWDEAVAYWKLLIDLDPKNGRAYFGLGNALFHLGELKVTPETAECYELAIENFEKAASLNPDSYAAFNNWGSALSGLAKLRNDEGLFRESFEKYVEAVRINPKYHEAYNNWGNALSGLGRLKGEAGPFEEAFEKYAEAVRIKPDKHDAYNNWGLALMELASLKGDDILLLEEASKKIKKAEDIKEGSGSYNMACIASLRNKSEECSNWLEITRKAGTLPSVQKLREDSDLDNVREEVWFKEFLAELEKDATDKEGEKGQRFKGSKG